jgi:4-amino-4-deoxy-L-arabinose transferase-like glycosyltransferase
MHTATPPPLAWRWLLGLAALDLTLLLLASGPFAYGYVTDEFYYLDSLDRMAWGYVDHPPLSVAALWLVRETLGDSLLAIRVLPSLMGSATVLLAGAMARELGGGRAAQALAALATLVCPLLLGMSSFHSMNALDLAVWALAVWLLLRILNGGDARLWLALGALLGLGLLNKFSVAWLALGLGAALLVTPERRWLATPWPWAAAALALAILAPHLAWQTQHGWPFVEFQRNAASRMPGRTPLGFVAMQLLVANPVAAPLWLGGLLHLLRAREARPQRLLGWTWLGVFLLLMASGRARSYYLGPAFSVAFAAGGVAVERLARSRSWRWLPASYAALLAVSGLATVPLALPFLPPERHIALQNTLGVAAPAEDTGGSSPIPIHMALMLHGSATVRAAKEAYASLPAPERAIAGIMTDTFGSAGAINVLGAEAGLPRAIGTTNSYWLWGPGAYDGAVMLVLAERTEEPRLRELFEEVERAAEIDCPHCMPFLSRRSFYVCRRARRSLAELWPELKRYR